MRTPSSAPADLAPLLEHWVAEDIISGEQAERIRTDTATAPAPPPPRGTSLVTEAMAYLGGVIILVGLGLVTGWFWTDLSTAVHIGLAGGVAILLAIAGAAVPRGLAGVGTRLRAVLWVASAGALAACLTLFATDVFGWEDNEVTVFAATGTTIAAAAMWLVHRTTVQHAATLLALLVTAAATTTLVSAAYLAPWVVVWSVGAVWCALAWFDLVPPRRTGFALGAVTAIFASLFLVDERWGTAMALVTVTALVALAVGLRDLVLLAVASVGTLVVLPAVVVQYFPGVLSAALALVIVGLILVAVAVFTTRRRRPPRLTAVPH